jgi:hypothetical protein
MKYFFRFVGIERCHNATGIRPPTGNCLRVQGISTDAATVEMAATSPEIAGGTTGPGEAELPPIDRE